MITVRPATRWDIPKAIELMLNYRQASPLACLKDSRNVDHVGKMFDHIIAGQGVILLAERDQEAIGMIVAVKQPNLWDPEVKQISELAYWVEPEQRQSRAGYLLIKEYIAWAKEQVNVGNCDFFTISKMINSPDLDYGRFGFTKLEESWRQ